MVAVLVVLPILWVIAQLLIDLHEDYVTWRCDLRREHIAQFLKPLSYSDRHRALLPLFEGMADELAVETVSYGREGQRVLVELELAWWARPRFLYKSRLRRKMLKLMEDGGIDVS